MKRVDKQVHFIWSEKNSKLNICTVPESEEGNIQFSEIICLQITIQIWLRDLFILNGLLLFLNYLGNQILDRIRHMVFGNVNIFAFLLLYLSYLWFSMFLRGFIFIRSGGQDIVWTSKEQYTLWYDCHEPYQQLQYSLTAKYPDNLI